MQDRGIRTIATAEDPGLVRSFRGHSKSVSSVCFDSEMKQIVSGGFDAVVHVWNFKPQLRPYKFIGHKGRVEDVAFSNDGKTIISAGEDKEIRFWKNSVQGKCFSIKAHSGPILKLSVARNDDFLISCSCDKTLKMWTLEGKFVRSFSRHTNWVRECEVSPDQRILLSCSDDRTLKLWDLERTEVLHSYSENKDKVLSCKFSPDGTSVAGASADGTIKIWDTRSDKLIQHYNAHEGQISRIAFHPYGFHLTSVSQEGKIKIWDLKTGRQGWTLFGHEGPIRAVAFNKAGDYFATGGADALVMIWKTAFDEGFSTHSRINERNYILKEEASGAVIQPLWRSNKVISRDKPCAEGALPEKDQSEDLPYHPLSEAMSAGLQKLVNQLDKLTKKILGLDERLQRNEQQIEGLMGHPRIQEVVERIEEEGLRKEHYNTVWQNFNRENNIDNELQRAFEGEPIITNEPGAGEVDFDAEGELDLQETIRLMDNH